MSALITKVPLEPIEVNWSDPFKLEGVDCRSAPYDGGWLVASAKGPRFCIFGKSLDDAKDIAERSIGYWRSIKLPER